jgi:hypothetical protein
MVWHRFCLSEMNDICLIRRQDISKKVPMLLYFGYMSIVSYGEFFYPANAMDDCSPSYLHSTCQPKGCHS